jgi:GT2 family glycosyltransferase
MGKLNIANIRKTAYYLKRNGIKNTFYAAKERMSDRTNEEYIPEKASEAMLKKQREWSENKNIKFSIVVPTYHTKEEYLRCMVDSVLHQSYTKWELIIADATDDDSVKNVINTYNDDRIKFIDLSENKGISENTNAGLKAVNGDYTGLLDHDDYIEPDLLYEAAVRIYESEKCGQPIKMLYTDEDKCNSTADKFYEPHYKEDFNFDLLLSNNYICHFLLIKSDIMKKLLLRKEYDGAQDYDLVLRAVRECGADRPGAKTVCHIAKVLYHWRCHAASTAENPGSKLYAYDAGRRALQAYADAADIPAAAKDLKHVGFYVLDYKEDIFKARPDLGAVGGNVIRRGKLAGGRMDMSGKVYYEGLPEYYSGYMHRAVLTQDAEAADIRCIRIRPELHQLFKETVGVHYVENNAGIFDISKLSVKYDITDDTAIKKLSLRLSKKITEAGFRILYSPDIKKKYSVENTGNFLENLSKFKDYKESDDSNNKGNAAKKMSNGKLKPNYKVSVVIPNYNGEKYLRGCLDSLIEEKNVDNTPAYNVIIVDNGSADKSHDILEEYVHKYGKKSPYNCLDVIYLSKNTGFCHAVNRGIKASDAQYVILLNNDTKVYPGFIKNLYKAIDKRPKAFSVSAKMLMWDRPDLIDDAGDYYCVLGWARAGGKGRPASEYDRSCRVFSACAGAAIYRKKIFDEIGLFDELHFAYMEDLDIGYRARINGYFNYYEPDAQVLHYGSASSGSRYNEFKTKLASANNVYVILKNMPLLQLVLNLPFLLVGFFVKFLFFCRKKMGILYLKGLVNGFKKGFSEAGRKQKNTFKIRNFTHYVIIQIELYVNLIRLILKKS